MSKWNKSKVLLFFVLILFVASLCTVLSGPAFFEKRSTVDREESTTSMPKTTKRASPTTTATVQATTKTSETTTTIYLQSMTTVRKTSSETTISLEERCAECDGKYDNRCGDALLDYTGGIGCELCGIPKCRFCRNDDEEKDEFLFCYEIP
jgi:hypothetical protein